ncbi:CoB/CoM heterodisulfide reductase, subunit C [Methanobacterium lacus]|uniref:CoB/CoM heterodisulfide reductase, subunit C n=2 Tax=Methanobacterium lacus (strain AL-21) TaxID=877455 RepID=F0TAS5_METLA|nr:CoB/CoM heterodisulfide reductase, subunit C [Methanobacterium lacus]
MKTLKRLKNMLSGEKEDKTETPQGEPVPESSKATPEETPVSTKTVKTEVKSTAPEQKSKATEVKSKAEDIKEDVKSKAEEIKSKTEDVSSDVKSKVEDISTDVKSKVEDVKSKAKDISEDAKSKASKTDEKIKKSEESKTDRSGKMTLLEGREKEVITRENIDPDFKNEVMDAGAESVALCFQCGTCTGACPSGRRTPYKIRNVVRKSVMGLKEEVIADDTIWMCTTCYECQERCPRGIKIVDVVKTVRNFAAQAGYMAPAHKMTGSFVIKTGHGVPINDATMALRKSVGLGELPPTTHQFPEALEEVQKIVKATGFDNLIGWNWDKAELE